MPGAAGGGGGGAFRIRPSARPTRGDRGWRRFIVSGGVPGVEAEVEHVDELPNLLL